MQLLDNFYEISTSFLSEGRWVGKGLAALLPFLGHSNPRGTVWGLSQGRRVWQRAGETVKVHLGRVSRAPCHLVLRLAVPPYAPSSLLPLFNSPRLLGAPRSSASVLQTGFGKAPGPSAEALGSMRQLHTSHPASARSEVQRRGLQPSLGSVLGRWQGPSVTALFWAPGLSTQGAASPSPPYTLPLT